jgi:pyridoxal phosphate enzyme (YggS family)
MTLNSPEVIRLAHVRETIAAAAERAGRSSESITLLAVSKTHPPEAISALLDAGQTVFGESRVQEARAKIPLVPGRAAWHFIGHLQRNKIRQALPLFDLIHGVDSLELARDIQRIAEEIGANPRILLEINLAAESTKYGFTPERLQSEIEEIASLSRLNLEGLMCIPPPQPQPEMSRQFFVTLRELRDRLQSEFRIGLPELSMGMSADYPIAVEEGATLVRVGTALFGNRSGKAWKPASDSAAFSE